MHSQLFWYTARASGIVAWALATASVLWGLTLSTRVLGRLGRAPWLLDLHRFLGGLAVLFTGAHVASLVADSYVHFGVADLLVPLASQWRPLPVALGVVAMELLVAVELTSLAMRRLPRRAWRAVHLTSFGVFGLATVHGLTAGTDAAVPLLRWAYALAATLVVFLTTYRALADPRAARPRRVPAAGSAPAAGRAARFASPAADPAPHASRPAPAGRAAAAARSRRATHAAGAGGSRPGTVRTS